MTRLFINGKFCLQRMTGVQRVASETVRALDHALAQRTPQGLSSVTLLVPPRCDAPELEAIQIRTVPGPASATVWEQTSLPRAASSGLLLNLAGSAPALGVERQLCVMHDAAVFDHPQAYTGAFGRWYRWLFRRQANRAAALMTVSVFSQGRLAHALGQARERWALLTPGAGHLLRAAAQGAVLERLGLAGRRFVLTVGSANPTKNHAALVQAWSQLAPGDGARLVIVGGSAANVFAAGRSLEAEGVLHTGPVGDGELRALMESARAMVLPSLYEGFGLPPLEAMTCGCPVAVANAASLPEVCADAALYFDPLSPAAIHEALTRVLRDDALLAALRTRGLERASHFSWSHTADQLIDALQICLRGRQWGVA